MVTTALSRNSTLLGCIYRSLASKITLSHLRSTDNPSFRSFHGFPLPRPRPPPPPPQSLLHPPLSPSEIHLDRRFQSCLATCHRFLCSNTSTATATVSPASSSASGSSGGNSGNEDKSDQSRNTSEPGKSVRGGPVSWLSFLLLVATGVGLIFYYDYEKRQHIEDINNASIAIKQGPSVGKAAIGGPFSLVNHNGKAVTDRDMVGKWTVMYFGFTHCPDICPDELQKLAAAVDKIKKNAGIEVVPVFISVDPERDTVEQVHEYVKEFHPNLIGLTGKPEEIRKVARAYRVYYMKTEEEGSDYLVDHSIVMYLMDPNMEFVKFYGKNNDVDEISDGIIKEIKKYEKVKA